MVEKNKSKTFTSDETLLKSAQMKAADNLELTAVKTQHWKEKFALYIFHIFISHVSF